ncbi:SRPBCC domain-containing protein [Rhodococcus sp. ABRD24]|uniref:SRPBCC domain-containing protein n=1 Tax=Rhodococcus sp. ABRD24 TaxID=2507582 RepID=UPI001F617E98|nr:SRPBCC domain-containing protein [Rhodococcus sp. ABRD24]
MEFETDDPDMRGLMTLSIELRDHPDGTELEALHTDLPRGVSAADNELGWNEALDRLSALVEDARNTDTTGREHL